MVKQDDIAQDTLLDTQLQPPPHYAIILHNDDYTPMNFVVELLMRFFSFNAEQSEKIMMTIHQSGRAVCGIYPAEIAETKVHNVNQYARQNQHPLLCTMEKV